MAGEPILIVDDTPVNLKLTRILLINEGYKVLTAASAEEALELLRSYHPSLVLADIQLPGIDGLELTRRIKQDERTRDITVVALTAYATKGDEQKAIDAGCDGYLTKPIDTRALGDRIRQFLDRRAETTPGPTTAPAGMAKAGIPPAELLALRRRFLDEGQEQVRQWLLDLEGSFNANEAARAVHQWIGAGGLLGYTAISRLSREVEATLNERPLDQAQLRDSLTNLALAFGSPKDARDLTVPESILKVLAGKKVAVVGLSPAELQRLTIALERAEAEVVPYEHTDQPTAEDVQQCDAVVIGVRPDTTDSLWLDPDKSPVRYRPLVLSGSREHLVALPEAVQATASEFLMDSWLPEEALVRLTHAVTALRPSAPSASTPAPAPMVGRSTVVLADDDPTVLALVRATLKNFGMDCHTAPDGRTAIDVIRKVRPKAAVLDVNMPGMDGYEVLAVIRSEQLPIQVLLLTARQQEADVIRAFSLGADDYVVKPFSPMELVARLKRLLAR